MTVTVLQTFKTEDEAEAWRQTLLQPSAYEVACVLAPGGLSQPREPAAYFIAPVGALG